MHHVKVGVFLDVIHHASVYMLTYAVLQSHNQNKRTEKEPIKNEWYFAITIPERAELEFATRIIF